MAGCDGIRAVVTGVGVVSPIGIGKDRFWDSLVQNRSGIDYLQSIASDDLPSPFAAEVSDFDPATMLRDRKFVKVMSRDMQLGAASANLAMKDAAINNGDIDPYRLGVVYGAGRMTTHPAELLAGVQASKDESDKFSMTRWGEGGMGRVAPLWLLRQLPNMPACHISIDHNAAVLDTAITTADLPAGGSETLDLSSLEPGTYELFCSIPGHKDSGMAATLVITDGGDTIDADWIVIHRPRLELTLPEPQR